MTSRIWKLNHLRWEVNIILIHIIVNIDKGALPNIIILLYIAIDIKQRQHTIIKGSEASIHINFGWKCSFRQLITSTWWEERETYIVNPCIIFSVMELQFLFCLGFTFLWWFCFLHFLVLGIFDLWLASLRLHKTETWATWTLEQELHC